MKNIEMNTNRMTTESKMGIKTKTFGSTSAITWNLKRRFK